MGTYGILQVSPLMQVTTKNRIGWNKEPFQTEAFGAQKLAPLVLVRVSSSVILHHGQMQLGEERICSSLKPRPQPIIKESGRNSAQGWRQDRSTGYGGVLLTGLFRLLDRHHV